MLHSFDRWTRRWYAMKRGAWDLRRLIPNNAGKAGVHNVIMIGCTHLVVSSNPRVGHRLAIAERCLHANGHVSLSLLHETNGKSNFWGSLGTSYAEQPFRLSLGYPRIEPDRVCLRVPQFHHPFPCEALQFFPLLQSAICVRLHVHCGLVDHWEAGAR